MLLLSLFVLFVSTQIFSMGEISPVDKGLKAEIINELKDAESKIATLANDIPQAKYTWRPEDGVRSVSEVILHVAGANYFFLSFLGIKMPDGAKMDSDFDKKTTNKEEILEFVKKSYSFTYDKIMSLKDKDLEKSVDFFGMKLTTRQLMIKAVGHNHEHLGQLIAYARMNGVTPSWSKKGN
jgi:uncharacterized damage-inducible protein DinB